MLKKVEDFEFAENARKVFEFIFEGSPETSKPKKFEIIEGGYKCDAQIFIGDARENALYSIVISIFKSTGDYKDWNRDLQLMKVRIRVPPIAEITLQQKHAKKCIAKLYIEEDSNEWLKTRNNPWHISQRIGHQLIMVYWRELIKRWDSQSELNEPLLPDKLPYEKEETDADKISRLTNPNKRGVSEKRKERANLFRKLKDAHPEWSYFKVAIEANHRYGDDLGKIVTEDDVRNDYRAMEWEWQRADKS